MTALSKEFYKQLNSIENFKELDYNDPQVVAVRKRADHELEAMELNKPKVKRKTRKNYTKFIYKMYENGEIIAIGTAREIATQVGLSSSTIVKFGTPKYVDKIDKNVNKWAEKVGKTE